MIRIVIVDDIPETRENVQKLLAFESDFSIVGQASTGREGLEVAIETEPDIILMDINMPDMDGITATQEIGQVVPTAAVVIMSVQKDSAYLRRAMLAGARDFLEKPISGDELYSTIRRVYELNEATREQFRRAAAAVPTAGKKDKGKQSGSTRSGNIVAVYSPQGGVGKTTIATNMAAAMMREDTRVLLVDCDLQFGDVEIFLYLQAKHTIINLAEAVDDLDPNLIENVLITHGSGLKVLLAPARPEDADTLPPDVVRKVISSLASKFDYIVLDMRSTFDTLAIDLFDISDLIVLVASATLPTIRSCRQVIDLYERLDYPPEKFMVILNRTFEAKDRSVIPMDAIERHLKVKISAKIPLDDKIFLNAINQGVPVIANNRNRSPAKDLIGLADLVRETLEFQDEEEFDDDEADDASSRNRFGRILGR